MNQKRYAAIILAAGRGVRMQSELPKALCGLSGRPMARYLIDAAKALGIKNIIVVGGYRIGLLKQGLSGCDIKIVRQKRLLGSADAVKCARPSLTGFSGTILVLYADTPLIKAETIARMLKVHSSRPLAATLLTGITDNPKDYGRLKRDKQGRISAIIEHTDLNEQEKKKLPAEINIGAYCFDSKKLFEGLGSIKQNAKKKEFYLTDIIKYFYSKNFSMASCTTRDAGEMLGINTREELMTAEEVIKRRKIDSLAAGGVIIKDPASVFISEDAKIGKGTVIHPFVVIDERVIIGKYCRVGPFANIRKGTVLKNKAEIGNFVEVVRSRIGKNSKAKHHSYIGDAEIGEWVNIGAGTITANYDGKSKNKTVIKDGAFIGSGTTIVAPVKIGSRAVTGAGSVIVKKRNVPAGTVVVGVPARPIKSVKTGGDKK